MRESRLTTISIIYGLKEYLHEQGFTTESSLSGLPFVPVLSKDQAYQEIVSPSIVVYPSNVYDTELQIGGGYWIRIMFHFDIYGRTEGQTLDLVDLVRTYVESPRWLLRYDQNTPTYQVLDGFVRTTYSSGSPTQVCQILFDNRTVDFFNRVGIVGEANAHAAQVSTVASITTD